MYYRKIKVVLALAYLTLGLSHYGSCFGNGDEPHIIEKDLVLDVNANVDRDIIITNGATMIIDRSVTLTTKRSIYIEGDSKLIVMGTVEGLESSERIYLQKGKIFVAEKSLIEWSGHFECDDNDANLKIDGTFVISGSFINSSRIVGMGSIMQVEDHWKARLVSLCLGKNDLIQPEPGEVMFYYPQVNGD